MKIVNICISAPYVEGFSYQENLLTDYFLLEGHDTTIIGSDIMPSHLKLKRKKTGISMDRGKKVIRLKCFRFSTEFLIPFGLYKNLKKENPDIIFHHNLNCTSLIICTLYKILNPNTVLLVDNHADNINNSKNKLWQFIYYKTLVRYSAKFAEKHTKKFYGVTYSRCDYLENVYKIKKENIEFLPIGVDLNTANSIKSNKKELRKQLKLPLNSFLVVSGGKMGINKGTDQLINAIEEIQKRHINIKLILFGSFNDQYTENLAKHSKTVILKGWCSHIESLSILKSADLAVWPIHHTTLIEDAISVNTALLLRKNRSTEHLIDDNGFFIEEDGLDVLISKIEFIINNYKSLKTHFFNYDKMKKKLDYKLIVQKIINDALLA